MRRVTAAVVTGAMLLLTWTAGMGVAVTAAPSPATPVQVRPVAHAVTLPVAVPVVRPVVRPGARWADDPMPVLRAWARQYPGKIQRAPRSWAEGRAGCWAVVGDTSFVWCPDGWFSIS